MNNPIRVVLADDHALVLEGLRSLLSSEPDISVIATATDGERLLDAVSRFHPDAVIADIQMPYQDGVACVPQIRTVSPKTRVILLTAFADRQKFHEILEAGADGLLLKTDPPDQAVSALRQVMAGQLVFPASTRAWLTAPKPEVASKELSPREWEVLELVAEGLTNAQVGQQLHISSNTVKFHLQNIFQHLHVSNRTEAGRWFHQHRPR